MARPVRHRGKWRIRWVDEKGKRQSEVHVTYNEAEFELRRHQLEVAEIERGLRSPTYRDRTLGQLMDHWEETRVPQKRSGEDDLSIIRVHLRPEFGALTLATFAADQATLVDRYINARLVKRLAKQTIANQLTLLNTMLRLAGPGDGCLNWFPRIVRVKKPKVRLFAKDFRWLRTTDEIRGVLSAARDEGLQVYVLYATAVFTGLREGELAGLRRDHVDLERRRITVEYSYDLQNTKGDDVRYVPIVDALLPILREWLLMHRGPLVFTNERGGMLREAGRVFNETLHRVLDAAAFPKEERRSKTGNVTYRRYITFHSFRHTFASHFMLNGGDLFRLQKILGHKSIELTERYAHLAPDALSGEYGRFSDAYVPARPADVIPIAARGRTR